MLLWLFFFDDIICNPTVMKIFAIGMNYAEHTTEFNNIMLLSEKAERKTAEPVIFTKADSALLKNGSVAGSTGRIELTKEAVSFIPKDGGGPGIRREIKKG